MGGMDEEARVWNHSPERAYKNEAVDDLSNGDEELLDNKDRKSRESSKHRSKERKKERGGKDRGRSKESEKEESSRKDLDRYVVRERDRERRTEDKSEYEKDRQHDRDRHRDKEKGREKMRERGNREPDHERERERSGDRVRDKGRERERDREVHKERDSTRDYERGKEREKGSEHARDRDREHERVQVRDKRHDKSRSHGKDYEELEREKLKDKDRGRGRDRGREREKEHDKVKDKEREKGKFKDREKEEKESDKEKDNNDKGKSKEKLESGREREDKSRSKDKEWDEDEETRGDGKSKEGETKGEKHERIDLGNHDDKLVGLQPTSEIEERLTKMRQERLKRKADNASEISSWVSKSRKIEDKRNVEKEKAARTSRILDEQDNIEEESDDDEAAARHSRKDLAGVKILHGLDKVIEGGAVVLTLKDQSILADGDINEEIDMLENVEIGEQRRRDDAYKAAKKKTGYEDKFNDDLSAPKTILPQYDDPVDDEGVTLDESGSFTGEAEKKLEELRKRIEGGSAIRPFENLTSTGKITSDYYTADEMLQFKKPKKKKSLRKREKLDLDALEAEAVSAGLGVSDLGSRKDSKRLSAKEEEAKHEAEVRSNAYQKALAKAEEASKVLREEQTLTGKSIEDDDLAFGEDYEDLEKSLEQARKLALKRKEDAAVTGPQAVALLAAANKEPEDSQNSMMAEPQENKVVITEMEEFVLGLQLNEETHKPEPEDVFNDEDDIPKPVEDEMEVEIGGWTEFTETNTDEQIVNEEKNDIAPDEIIHEVAVGKGLSGALKLLKDRGTLKESIDWGGRNMDKKKSKLVGINDNDGPKEIRIERTDEFGRIMTPKEAFRMISHKFHGKGPGKMKQEKRMKQYQEDLKTKQMKASDTPLLAMERMREAQVQLKSPYIVLSGHVKPGQTSDPRSGFATVEKDPGSLTPMLGDKKVEHFLGISRKTDMGPPPPRKPKN